MKTPLYKKEIQNTKQASKKCLSNLAKIFKMQKPKLKVPDSKGSVIICNTIYKYFALILLFPHRFLNIYVNDYDVINEHIPSDGYNICTLYDCWGGAGF